MIPWINYDILYVIFYNVSCILLICSICYMIYVHVFYYRYRQLQDTERVLAISGPGPRARGPVQGGVKPAKPLSGVSGGVNRLNHLADLAPLPPKPAKWVS